MFPIPNHDHPPRQPINHRLVHILRVGRRHHELAGGDHAHAVEEVHLAFEAGGDDEAVVAELDVLDACVLHRLAHIHLGDLDAALLALHDVGVLDLDAGRHVVDDEAVGVAAFGLHVQAHDQGFADFQQPNS